MLRSFHPEKTPSHQNWEVNLDWAVSVLGREITWEPTVTQCFAPHGNGQACQRGGRAWLMMMTMMMMITPGSARHDQ